MTFSRLSVFLFVFYCGSFASSSPVFTDTLTPKQVVEHFDSLMNQGKDDQARHLCAGTALRMFSFLAEAQHKLDPFIDSAKSRDTIIEQKCVEKWCALKVVSDAVFTKTVMGMDQMHSVQAVHLFRARDGWKLSEFEELANEKSPLIPRSGIPLGVDTTSGPLFPVSAQAPAQGNVTRLHLKISLRNGDSLPALPEGPGQKIITRDKSSATVETFLPTITPLGGAAKKSQADLGAGTGGGFPSSHYLDLTDTLLLAKAVELRTGTNDPLEIASRIYNFVSTSFQFKLGAALFGTSREVIRSMQGDCSEAAVLTATLLRADGIPSRVVLGFATLSHGVFIGHAWAEAQLNGEWIGVDPALREFPAGAQRVALLRLSGSEDMQVAASNLMLQSLSNLDIQITDAWNGSSRLPLITQRGNAAEAQQFFEDVLRGVGK